MFTRAVRLFEIFGFQIKVDPSWLLIAALLVWTLSGGYFPERVPGLSHTDYLGLAVIAMLAFFAGLILHELAHSLVARRFGLGIGGITLFIFGGVAELDEEPASPVSEFWIAIAGPAMSFALAGLAWFAKITLEGADVSESMQAVFEYLALINLILAVFNLLPAFPLDGGRVLRAALWKSSGDLVRATRNASAISELVAYVLIGLGLISLFSGGTVGGLWQILIGFFLLSAARATYQQLVIKTSLANRTVSKMMSTEVHQAGPDDTLSSVVDDIMLAHAISFVPVTDGEHLLGYIDAGLMRRIDRENWDSTHVGDIFIAADAENTLEPDFPADALLQRIATSGRRKYLVAERQRFLGVITLTDLLSYLAVLQDLGPYRPTASSVLRKT